MRLAAQAKAGFYPTPKPIYEAISKYLKCQFNDSNGLIRMIDPCVGDGEPLAYIAKLLRDKTIAKIETYGIEISHERGRLAKEIIDHCLITDYKKTRISNRVFNLLYLNPPYDDETMSLDMDIQQSKRYELSFLKDSIRYLKPDGILVYIIPRLRISVRVARILSHNFRNIKIFQFPSDLYDRFKQVVIFAKFKRKIERDLSSEQYLIKCGRNEVVTPNIITSWLNNYYDVPVLSNKQRKSKILFSTTAINPNELIDEIKQHGLIEDFVSKFNMKTIDKVNTRPIMPMKYGHLAQALASGLMNGVVTDKNGENPLLVRGSTRKVIDTQTTGIGENAKTVETHRVKIRVNAYNQEGELLTIE